MKDHENTTVCHMLTSQKLVNCMETTFISTLHPIGEWWNFSRFIFMLQNLGPFWRYHYYEEWNQPTQESARRQEEEALHAKREAARRRRARRAISGTWAVSIGSARLQWRIPIGFNHKGTSLSIILGWKLCFFGVDVRFLGNLGKWVFLLVIIMQRPWYFIFFKKVKATNTT